MPPLRKPPGQDDLLSPPALDVVVPGWLLDTNLDAWALAVYLFRDRDLSSSALAVRLGTTSGVVDRCRKQLRDVGVDSPRSGRETTEERDIRQAAAAVARRVWDERTPRPLLRYVALTAMARRALAAGWADEEVVDAMLTVPTFTDRALEFALAETRGRRSASNTSVARRVARQEGLIP